MVNYAQALWASRGSDTQTSARCSLCKASHMTTLNFSKSVGKYNPTMYPEKSKKKKKIHSTDNYQKILIIVQDKYNFYFINNLLFFPEKMAN